MLASRGAIERVSTSAPPRPPQVTLAGWMIIIGSVLVVVTVFEVVSDLRSLETREGVEAFHEKRAPKFRGT